MTQRVAEISLKHGARRFLLISAAGGSRKSHFFYSRIKAELEEAVSAMPAEAAHIFSAEGGAT